MSDSEGCTRLDPGECLYFADLVQTTRLGLLFNNVPSFNGPSGPFSVMGYVRMCGNSEVHSTPGKDRFWPIFPVHS